MSAPQSPCVGICRIGDHGFCEGCWRTLDEIAAWQRLDEQARQAVIDRLEARAGQADVSA